MTLSEYVDNLEAQVALLKRERAVLRDEAQDVIDVIRMRIFDARSGDLRWVEQLADRLQRTLDATRPLPL